MKYYEQIRLPAYVQAVIHTIEQAGFEAYAVGGCVRDSLLRLEPHDWDVTTNALPQEVCAALPQLHVIETGIRHGTVTVVIDGNSVEVTTYRTEGCYTDHRHPDEVQFVRSLAEDLKRRDFTINAMAYHPDRGIVDLYGGREDLEAGQLRTVGPADARFQEDALRILRALRFAAVYGFEIEEETAQAMQRLKSLLTGISAERIASEFSRLLTGKTAAGILRRYADVLGVVIPELLPMIGLEQRTSYHHLDVWEHTLAALDAVKPEKQLRLAVLFHDIGKPNAFTVDESGTGHFYHHAAVSAEMTSKILRRLRFDRDTIVQVRDLVLHHGDEIACSARAVKRWMGRIGLEMLRNLLEVKRADAAGQPEWVQSERFPMYDTIERMMEQILEEGSCFSVRNLQLDGKDLLKAGVQEGPEIGNALRSLTDAVIDGKVKNEKEALLKYYFS